MTKQEKIIVSAYTGVLMCDFDDVHEYIQKKVGRPVWTHELTDKGIQKEVEEKLKEEFLEICNREEPERKTGKWIPLQLSIAHPLYQCSCCFKNAPMVETGSLVNRYLEALLTDFCPNCGADMRGEQE